ncbi:CPBP family intramembrane glutamic endopeptidase [Paenibacillus wulumuqiensis]|uniref:CPBP family intramembrane glutamic endopeptidase n=1 Tax=Paenibacillus wulumuqiensis TaxID=1567107 RepID=UPI000619EF5A|nr:CPBP family intramembrane glutamic endopeptidase [Paenibacillus wulumuqiensis]
MESYRTNDRVTNKEDPNIVHKSRKGLLVFFAWLVPLTFLSYVLAIYVAPVFALLLMWSPGLSSLLTRLLLREGFTDISFRFRGNLTLKSIPFVLLFPVIIGILAYGLAWITGLVDFVPTDNSYIWPLVVSILYQLSVGTLFGMISSAGEELGWRGYMLSRLITAGVPKPIMTSGLIWGAWHIPAILLGSYYSGPSLILSILLFLITISSFNFIISQIRLSTGSIWPAILFHASWNAVIQGSFDASTKGENAYLWTGESGILVALIMALAAWIFSRKSGFMYRTY